MISLIVRLRSRKMNTQQNECRDFMHIFGLIMLNSDNMPTVPARLSCNTSSFLYSTPILSPELLTVEMTCWTRKDTTDWSSEMRNRSSLKVIVTVLAHLLHRKTVPGKGKNWTPSRSSFCVPVETLETLIVSLSLMETYVSVSTY